MRGAKSAKRGTRSIFDEDDSSFKEDLFGESPSTKKNVDNDLFKLSSSESSRIKKLKSNKESDLFGSGSNRESVNPIQGENLLATDNLFLKPKYRSAKKQIETKKEEVIDIPEKSDNFVLDVSFEEDKVTKFDNSDMFKMNINAKFAVSSDYEKDAAQRKEAVERKKASQQKEKTDSILFGSSSGAKTDIFSEDAPERIPVTKTSKKKQNPITEDNIASEPAPKQLPVEKPTISTSKLFGDDIFSPAEEQKKPEASIEEPEPIESVSDLPESVVDEIRDVEIAEEKPISVEAVPDNLEVVSQPELKQEEVIEVVEAKQDEKPIPEESNQPLVKQAQVPAAKSIFDDDDDLLAPKKKAPTKRSLFDEEEETVAKKSVLNNKRSLFDDDDDFLMAKKPQTKRSAMDIDDFLPPIKKKTDVNQSAQRKKTSFFSDDN